MFKTMLAKEFILILRDRHALAALFIMPAIFILIMSLALKDTLRHDPIEIEYSLIDLDHSVLSARFEQLLGRQARLRRRLAAGNPAPKLTPAPAKSGSALTINPGFAQNHDRQEISPVLLEVALPTSVRPGRLLLFKTEITRALIRLRLETIMRELAFSPAPTATQSQFFGDAGRPEIPALETFFLDTEAAITLRYAELKAGREPSSTQQSVPSWIVFGMFFIIIPISTIFINERRRNTLMRMTAMNISLPALFIGKITPYLVINQLQAGLMLAVGVFIVPLCGAEALQLGNSIGGLALVSVGLSLAAVGTSMLIAVSATTVEQATTIGVIINILLGAIGGIMVPKTYMPEPMQQLAGLSPMSWGLEGFLDIFLRDRGLQAVLGEALALAAFGLGLLLAAGVVFHFKTNREQ